MDWNWKLQEAIRDGKQDGLLEALDQGADASPRVFGSTPLELCQKYEHPSMAVTLLERGADPNVRIGRLNDTVLHRACRVGDYGFAALLLSHYADPNLINKHGQTALHLSARRGDQYLVKQLLDRGANPKIRDNQGRSPGGIADDNGHADVAKMLGFSKAPLLNLSAEESPLAEAPQVSETKNKFARDVTSRRDSPTNCR